MPEDFQPKEINKNSEAQKAPENNLSFANIMNDNGKVLDKTEKKSEAVQSLENLQIGDKSSDKVSQTPEELTKAYLKQVEAQQQPKFDALSRGGQENLKHFADNLSNGGPHQEKIDQKFGLVKDMVLEKVKN